MDDVERMFKKHDTNRSGCIDIAKLGPALEDLLRVSVADAQVRRVMAKYDTDKSGALDLPEFRLLVKEWRALGGTSNAVQDAYNAALDEVLTEIERFIKPHALLKRCVLTLMTLLIAVTMTRPS